MQLTERVGKLASVALATPPAPDAPCDSCKENRHTERECNSFERALCRLWTDLTTNACRRSQETGTVPAGSEPERMLVMLRDITVPAERAGIQRVRYVWFPRQLDAMFDRVQGHFQSVHPVEHVLRCLLSMESKLPMDEVENRVLLRNSANELLDAAVLSPVATPREMKALPGLPAADWKDRAGLWSWVEDVLESDPELRASLTDGARIWDSKPCLFRLDGELPGRHEQQSARSLLATYRMVLENGSFPLDLALSNSMMDGGALERVADWTSEGRVARLKLTGEPEGKGDGYPAILLLSEVGTFTPAFSASVLYVPWVAPVGGVTSVGEYPAFGLVMLAPEPDTGHGIRLDPTRAAIIVRGYSAALHTALLQAKQRVLQPSEQGDPTGVDHAANRGINRPVEATTNAILGVLSLSGRVKAFTREVTAEGRRPALEHVFDPFQDSRTRFSVQFDVPPSSFHYEYARMLEAVVNIGLDRKGVAFEQVLGHEPGKIVGSAMRWVEALADRSADQAAEFGKWMVESSLRYTLLHVDVDGKAAYGSPLPRVWEEDGSGRNVREYLQELTGWAWQVFARRNGVLRNVYPNEPLASNDTAQRLRELEKNAANLLDTTEVAATLSFKPSGAFQVDDEAAFAARLARWLLAAVSNAFEHRYQDYLERRQLSGRAPLEAWQSWQGSGETALRITADTADFSSQIRVTNPCNAGPNHPKNEGTGLVLDFVAGQLKAESFFDRDPVDDTRWLATLTLPRRVIWEQR